MSNNYRFTAVCTILALAAMSVQASQDRVTSGTVRDVDGHPMGKVTLILAPPNIDPAAAPDLLRRIPVAADGSFEVELPDGDYVVIGTSPSCFVAHDITADGTRLEVVLRTKRVRETDSDVAGGSVTTFRLGGGVAPTTASVLGVGRVAAGSLTTQGSGGFLNFTHTKTPNGGGIGVDPEPECERWIAK